MIDPVPLADRVDAIAIGASAGGIDALAALLPALPSRSRIAVFIVVHLPRDRPSLLRDVLASHCTLPVVEAEDKMPVEPGIVYVAPPDYHLLIDAGPSLALSVDEQVNYSRPSIDVLFESAAYVYGSRLLGMILTGASRDGARGLQAVHLRGGLAAVQQPETAQVPVMAEAALAGTPSAQSLTLDAIATWLGTLHCAPADTEVRR